MPSYVLAGELAINEVLRVSSRARRSRPGCGRRRRRCGLASRRERWRIGDVRARRGDPIAAFANLTQAVLATAQGRLAAAGQWALSEKGIVERAGLRGTQSALTACDAERAATALADILELPTWR